MRVPLLQKSLTDGKLGAWLNGKQDKDATDPRGDWFWHLPDGSKVSLHAVEEKECSKGKLEAIGVKDGENFKWTY